MEDEKDKTYISSINSGSEFLKKRTVFMDDDFDDDTVAKLRKQLIYLYDNDQEKPITIMISSWGGSLHEAFSLYGLLKTFKCKIITVAIGKAMSAGAFLLMLGDERCAYPGTRIMTHEMSYERDYDKHSEHIKKMKYDNDLHKFYVDVFKKHTKIENPAEFLKSDRYMWPKEAKKLGIIDKVL